MYHSKAFLDLVTQLYDPQNNDLFVASLSCIDPDKVEVTSYYGSKHKVGCSKGVCHPQGLARV